MNHSSGPRKTANLSKSTHQQLTMYALAASAAGVTLLALAPPQRGRDHLHQGLPCHPKGAGKPTSVL